MKLTLDQIKNPALRAQAIAQIQAGRPQLQRPCRIEHPEIEGLNKLERAYAAHLESRRIACDILWFKAHPCSLRLGHNRHYRPDFLVQFLDRLEFHETKGFMRDDAREKVKNAAREFWPIKFVIVRRVRGEWQWEEVVP